MCEQLGLLGRQLRREPLLQLRLQPQPADARGGARPAHRAAEHRHRRGRAAVLEPDPVRRGRRHRRPAPERPPRTRGRPRIPAAGVRGVRAPLRRAPGTFHRGAGHRAAGLDPTEIQVEGKYYQVPRAINVLPKPYDQAAPPDVRRGVPRGLAEVRRVHRLQGVRGVPAGGRRRQARPRDLHGRAPPPGQGRRLLHGRHEPTGLRGGQLLAGQDRGGPGERDAPRA